MILDGWAGMHPERPPDLCDRSFEFTCDIYDYCDELVKLRGLPCRLAYQLFDAAGSIGANRTEAESAYSDKEFASKNSICLKECSEARFWLRLADRKNLGDAGPRKRLLREAGELVHIYAMIVNKLKTEGQESHQSRRRARDKGPGTSAGNRATERRCPKAAAEYLST
jgi:four helix bundle protein